MFIPAALGTIEQTPIETLRPIGVCDFWVTESEVRSQPIQNPKSKIESSLMNSRVRQRQRLSGGSHHIALIQGAEAAADQGNPAIGR